MKLKVGEYNKHYDANRCILPNGRPLWVDLVVDDAKVGLPEDLVGKTVEVDYTYSFLDIASGVRVLEGRSWRR